MNAYEILMIITLSLSILLSLCAWLIKKETMRDAIRVLVVALLICSAVLLLAAICFSINDDRVTELRAWRQMVENGEIEVYDDVGHLTWEAQDYNIEVALMQDGIARFGRWSQYYGTGAESLTPITRRGQSGENNERLGFLEAGLERSNENAKAQD